MTGDAGDQRALADVPIEHLIEGRLSVRPHLGVLDQGRDVRRDLQVKSGRQRLQQGITFDTEQLCRQE